MDSRIKELFDKAQNDDERKLIEQLHYHSPIIPKKFTQIEIVALIERCDFYLEKYNTSKLELWLEYYYTVLYSIFVGVSKDLYHESLLNTINQLISDNAVAWVGRLKQPFEDEQVEKRKFILRAQSVVTCFLFQPPYISAKEKLERDIREEIFKSWVPNWYVIDFCEKLDKVFLNL